jgi:hypothetical protein
LIGLDIADEFVARSSVDDQRPREAGDWNITLAEEQLWNADAVAFPNIAAAESRNEFLDGSRKVEVTHGGIL